jgi:hypothetical protein
MKGSTYFVLMILLLAVTTIILSLQIPTFKARFLPLMIGIAIALFAVIRLLVELTAKEERASAAKETVSAPIQPIPMIITSAWLVGFFLMIYLVGFPLGIFLFVTGYIKVRRYGWIKSIAIGFVTTTITYVGFDYVLGLHLYKGVLFSYLFRFAS